MSSGPLLRFRVSVRLLALKPLFLILVIHVLGGCISLVISLGIDSRSSHFLILRFDGLLPLLLKLLLSELLLLFFLLVEVDKVFAKRDRNSEINDIIFDKSRDDVSYIVYLRH